MIVQSKTKSWKYNLDWAEMRQEAIPSELLKSWKTEPFVDLIVVDAAK